MAVRGAEMSSCALENIAGFLIEGLCWFITSSGASWVKSETGLYPCRAGREWRKRKEADHFTSVVAVLKNKGTSLRGCLEQLQDSSFSPAPTRVFKVEVEAPSEFSQSYTQSGWPQHHISVSRPYLRSSFWKWGRQAENTFQGQERGWGAPNWPGPAHRLTGGHV